MSLPTQPEVVSMSSWSAVTVANATDDYSGVKNSDPSEGIVRWPGLPTAHRQATRLLDVGDLVKIQGGTARIGMAYDGKTLAYHLDGASKGSVSETALSIAGAGVASNANSEAGVDKVARYAHLWIGSVPIAFDPLTVTTGTTTTVMGEAPF